jgi:hypothetical protein
LLQNNQLTPQQKEAVRLQSLIIRCKEEKELLHKEAGNVLANIMCQFKTTEELVKPAPDLNQYELGLNAMCKAHMAYLLGRLATLDQLFPDITARPVNIQVPIPRSTPIDDMDITEIASHMDSESETDSDMDQD